MCACMCVCVCSDIELPHFKGRGRGGHRGVPLGEGHPGGSPTSLMKREGQWVSWERLEMTCIW